MFQNVLTNFKRNIFYLNQRRQILDDFHDNESSEDGHQEHQCGCKDEEEYLEHKIVEDRGYFQPIKKMSDFCPVTD